jgi:tagatose 6-phosphate kinase
VIVVGGFNTAIDKTMDLAELRSGTVNRVHGVRSYAGGKGLHVARTVAALGEAARLVGLIDATHRRMFEDALGPSGVAFHGVEVGESVRTCLAIREADGARVTEILEPGPLVEEPERSALCDTFLSLARGSPLAVLSGSVPRGFGEDVYAGLVSALRGTSTRCLVDASGELLRAAVEAGPFLVKPNRDEIEALLGERIESLAAAAAAARRLCERGIPLVVLSLGAQGALLASTDHVCHAVAPVQPERNAVGSGDCLLGGIAVGLARGLPSEEVLRLGVACGAANAMNAETGQLARGDVESILPHVRAKGI